MRNDNASETSNMVAAVNINPPNVIISSMLTLIRMDYRVSEILMPLFVFKIREGSNLRREMA